MFSIGALDWSRTATPTPLNAATLEEVSGTRHPLLYSPTLTKVNEFYCNGSQIAPEPRDGTV
jgi:hypothetical protein